MVVGGGREGGVESEGGRRSGGGREGEVWWGDGERGMDGGGMEKGEGWCRTHSPGLTIAHVCPWALAIVRELWWLFWLVVVHTRHGGEVPSEQYK